MEDNDEYIMRLPPEAFDELVADLERPAEPVPGLVELFMSEEKKLQEQVHRLQDELRAANEHIEILTNQRIQTFEELLKIQEQLAALKDLVQKL